MKIIEEIEVDYSQPYWINAKGTSVKLIFQDKEVHIFLIL